MAGGGEGGASGPRRCPEVGVGRFLSARESGASQPVQEEREPEDGVCPHQTQGDDSEMMCLQPDQIRVITSKHECRTLLMKRKEEEEEMVEGEDDEGRRRKRRRKKKQKMETQTRRRGKKKKDTN